MSLAQSREQQGDVGDEESAARERDDLVHVRTPHEGRDSAGHDEQCVERQVLCLRQASLQHQLFREADDRRRDQQLKQPRRLSVIKRAKIAST